MVKLSTFYESLDSACGVAFLVAVPLTLVVRAMRPQRMPWRRVVILAVAFGWVFRLLAVLALQAYQEESLHDGSHAFSDGWAPDPYLVLLLGWLAGLEYLGMLLVPYWIVWWVRRRYGANRPDTGQP